MKHYIPNNTYLPTYEIKLKYASKTLLYLSDKDWIWRTWHLNLWQPEILAWKTTLCQLNLKTIWYPNLNLNSNWKTKPRNPLTFKSWNLWNTKPKNLKQCIDTQNSDKHREPEETIWQTLNPQNNNIKKRIWRNLWSKPSNWKTKPEEILWHLNLETSNTPKTKEPEAMFWHPKLWQT